MKTLGLHTPKIELLTGENPLSVFARRVDYIRQLMNAMGPEERHATLVALQDDFGD